VNTQKPTISIAKCSRLFGVTPGQRGKTFGIVAEYF